MLYFGTPMKTRYQQTDGSYVLSGGWRRCFNYAIGSWVNRGSLTYADVSSRILTYPDVSYRILTYPDAYPRILTYATYGQVF